MRPPSVAGAFYPSDGLSLTKMIDTFLNSCKEMDVEGKLRGLIVPHAGYIFSGIVAASGYRVLMKHKDEISKIFLLGPSHYSLFNGAASSGEDVWETPLGMVNVHPMEGSTISILPSVHRQEHSLEVQIPFIQIACPKAELYPLLLGNVDPIQLSRDLLSWIDDRTLILISSDLSHYYTYEKANKVDSYANKCIPSLDIKCVEHNVEACGKLGILALMHVAKVKSWKGMLLDYKNSGDTSGDKSTVVGYGCYVFTE